MTTKPLARLPERPSTSARVIGRMFQEFAVTVSAAIAVSVIVSPTLTPMMCAYLLKARGRGKAGPHLTGAGIRLRRVAIRLRKGAPARAAV
jgi:multidrug efflux pump subunit AcrB